MKDVPKAIEAAAIARVTHDIGIADELAQDTPVTALELWPEEGSPKTLAFYLTRPQLSWGVGWTDHNSAPMG